MCGLSAAHDRPSWERVEGGRASSHSRYSRGNRTVAKVIVHGAAKAVVIIGLRGIQILPICEMCSTPTEDCYTHCSLILYSVYTLKQGVDSHGVLCAVRLSYYHWVWVHSTHSWAWQVSDTPSELNALERLAGYTCSVMKPESCLCSWVCSLPQCCVSGSVTHFLQSVVAWFWYWSLGMAV